MPDNEFPQEPGQSSLPPAAHIPEPEPGPGDTPPDHLLPQPTKTRGIAPVWHTLILVLGILAFSIWGAVSKDSNPLAPTQPLPAAHVHSSAQSQEVNTERLIRYALTGLLELTIVGWVIFGLRLRKIPFRSLFGAWPRGLNDITKEGLIAAVFWLNAMLILVGLAFIWLFAETQIDKYQEAHQAPQAIHSHPGPSKKAPSEKTSEEKQSDLIRELTELAPANGIEIACWGALCIIVGFSEEVVFRGYLQTQSIAILRKLPVGLVFTALIFGLAHGYQGLRGMVLISVYGLLFGMITVMRRNLFPGMLAHAWHDFFTGLMLALIRASGLLERLHHTH